MCVCVCVCVDVFFRREEGRFVAESHTSSVLERPERGAPYRAKRPNLLRRDQRLRESRSVYESSRARARPIEMWPPASRIT